jgi:hypothetical protein
MIRLLRNIRDLKSFATRKRVVYKVCGNNFRIKTFDLLLKDELLCNAIVVVLHQRKNRQHGKPVKWRRSILHRKFRPGRPALLFKLTREGHALLRRLMTAQAAERAAVAQSRELAAQAREAKRQAGAEKKIKREVAEATRKAAHVAADLARRTEGFELPAAPPEHVHRATTLQVSPGPYPGPGLTPPAQFNRPAPPMTTTSIGGPSLIEKIRKAGYRVNDQGLVAFDNRWIAIDEWRRRMPSVDLS